MSVPDVRPDIRPLEPAPGFGGHLGRIALVCCALLAGAYMGALAKALIDGTSGPAGAALARADDVSEPVLVVAVIAALFAALRAALGEGMTRRRRLVALRRRLRSWLRFAPLLWIPVLGFIVIAEGWMLLIAFAAPIIVIGLTWTGGRLSAAALRAGPPTYGVVALVGLAIGLFA